MLRMIVLILALAPVLLPAQSPPGSHAAQSEPGRTLNDLWVDVLMGRPLVEWFNEMAWPDDMARVEEWEPHLLDEIGAGRRLMVFKSIGAAEAFLETSADAVDVVGYNLERDSPSTPPEEKDDPVESVRRMRELADRYCKRLALGPDQSFTASHGVEIAPYADVFVLQVQRIQHQPERVRDYVIPMSQALRQVNPELEISVQVGRSATNSATVDELVDLLDSLKEHLDGVSILTGPDYVDETQELVARLRSEAGSSHDVVSSAYLPTIVVPPSHACSQQ